MELNWMTFEAYASNPYNGSMYCSRIIERQLAAARQKSYPLIFPAQLQPAFDGMLPDA
jgi:hypothetical protein